MKKYIKNSVAYIFTAAVVFAMSLFVCNIDVSAKNVSKTLYIGQRYHIKAGIKNVVSYKSYDKIIAYVDNNGVITGKKAGSVKIKVSGKNGKKAFVDIKVCNTKKDKRPSLPVVFDEVKKTSVSLKEKAENDYVYTANVTNRSKTANIKKIVYTYKIKTKGIATGAAVHVKTVNLTFKNVKAGRKSKNASCKAGYTGKYKDIQLQKIELYSGSALYIYNAEKNKYTLKWGTKDKKAPVFSGWINKKSVYKSQIYKTCYSDWKKSYDFKDHIKAEDDRDGKVKIKVDTSKINWKRDGVYKVRYTAVDKAGNKAHAWAKIQVYVPSTAESIADEVLSSIVRSSWSDTKKARAIYSYVRKTCRYVDNGTHSDWRKVAVAGIRYGSGDCYTYYSVARLLLTRAGIMNFTITRYPAYTGGHHWWNLVYVKGGWYHFDTTPRTAGGVFCLLTDKQLKEYSAGRRTFSFKESLYPKRATKVISKTPHRK